MPYPDDLPCDTEPSCRVTQLARQKAELAASAAAAIAERDARIAELEAALRRIVDHGSLALADLPQGPGRASAIMMRDAAWAALGDAP